MERSKWGRQKEIISKGVGKEPNMDSDDVWSTSLKSAEQGKGRKEGVCKTHQVAAVEGVCITLF
jgi:hypothetical protein